MEVRHHSKTTLHRNKTTTRLNKVIILLSNNNMVARHLKTMAATQTTAMTVIQQARMAHKGSAAWEPLSSAELVEHSLATKQEVGF